MSQIFHHSTNTLSKLSIFGALFLAAGTVWLVLEVNRSPYVTQAGVAREQPVPFSHQHHVGGLGIDCRYCHTAVETSATAGIPPTSWPWGNRWPKSTESTPARAAPRATDERRPRRRFGPRPVGSPPPPRRFDGTDLLEEPRGAGRRPAVPGVPAPRVP